MTRTFLIVAWFAAESMALAQSKVTFDTSDALPKGWEVGITGIWLWRRHQSSERQMEHVTSRVSWEPVHRILQRKKAFRGGRRNIQGRGCGRCLDEGRQRHTLRRFGVWNKMNPSTTRDRL